MGRPRGKALSHRRQPPTRHTLLGHAERNQRIRDREALLPQPTRRLIQEPPRLARGGLPHHQRKKRENHRPGGGSRPLQEGSEGGLRGEAEEAGRGEREAVRAEAEEAGAGGRERVQRQDQALHFADRTFD